MDAFVGHCEWPLWEGLCLSCLNVSCLVLSGLVLSYLIPSYLILSYLVLCCLVLSYLQLFCKIKIHQLRMLLTSCIDL